MKYTEFLTMVIDGGIEQARRDYAHDMFKRDGAVAGFEACRGKHPGDLAVLLTEAREKREAARVKSHHHGLGSGIGDYWKKEAIEWGWELLVQRFHFEAGSLVATIYKDDDEAYDISVAAVEKYGDLMWEAACDFITADYL